MAMEDLPIQKVKISGPTLSSLLHHFSSSSGPTHGFLFGTLSLSSPSLSDDDVLSSPSLSATLTAFSSSSTATRHSKIGHFSTRRHSPLRPSLLDHSISLSLSSPSLFLLLTSPSSETLIHTHEYRVYQFRPSLMSFEAVPMEVVNIGPGFRGQYGSFSPNSEIPMMECGKVGSPMREDEKEVRFRDMKRVGKDQKDLEAYVAEGYDVGRLSRLTGVDAVAYMGGVEELYEKMLAKLASLASAVESSNARVLELENHNVKLRRRVAGIE